MDIFWNLPIPGSRVNWCSFVLSAETGGICIAPRPSEDGAEILPGMAMRPFFGIVPALMDEKVRGILQRLSPAHLPCYSSGKPSTCPAFCPLLRCRVWFPVSRPGPRTLSASPSQTALLMSAASQGPHRTLPEGSSGQFHSVLHGFCLRSSSQDYADGQSFAFLPELARSLMIAFLHL